MEYAKYLLNKELEKCTEDLKFLEKQPLGDPGLEISRFQLTKKIEDLKIGLEKLRVEIPLEAVNMDLR